MENEYNFSSPLSKLNTKNRPFPMMTEKGRLVPSMNENKMLSHIVAHEPSKDNEGTKLFDKIFNTFSIHKI